jgi:5-methylcytosine-specific restriction enzyme subunit McrC
MPDPIVQLTEWEARELEGVSLTERDRKLAEDLVRTEGGKLSVTELRSGLRIEARSWVGVVQFERFAVRIVPKLAGENLGLVRLIEFTTGLDALRRIRGQRLLEVQGSSLLDLLVLLLAEACEDILRAGLLKDYVEREDALPVLRGRLLGARQVLERFGRVDQVVCRFDEHEHDVVENQILAAALRAIAPKVGNVTLRHRTHRLQGVFSEVCDPDALDLDSARHSLEYQRQNEHYRQAHMLAWIVVDATGVEDVLASGDLRCFPFLVNMDRLFELFIARLIDRVLTGTGDRIQYQRRDRSIIWDEDKRRPYSAVVPDVLIARRSGNQLTRLPVDAKYKLYDGRRVSPGDIYQSFLYAYVYGTRGARSGVIVHPSSTGAATTRRLSVRAAGGLAASSLYVLSLPIPKALDEAERRAFGPILASMREVLEASLAEGTAAQESALISSVEA